MIVQFPTPYPDELLYSVLARYHIRSGNIYWKHTLEDLFGRQSISATVLLPSGIRSLVSRLPQNTTLNEQILVEKHTLYPFYSSFLPVEKAESIYKDMLSDDGKRIYMQAGLMASSIPQNKYFKYCSACLKDGAFGEMYWHRQHQLPGKLICSKHNNWLEDSTVSIVRGNKHSFILPTTDNCDLTKENPVDMIYLQQFDSFMRQVEKLMKWKHNNNSFAYFTGFYRKRLIDKGFASINGQVYQKELEGTFKECYSESMLRKLHAEVKSSSNNQSWLNNITRKHRKSFHPYYHILMLNFLGLDIDDVFMKTPLVIHTFDQEKYPCLNIVCTDYKKDFIDNISVRSCERTKLPIRRFSCSTCGFTYTRKGRDQKSEDRYKYTRIMEFGFLWKEKLQSLLQLQLSYREIARRLNVDTNTIRKYEKIINGEVVISEESNRESKSVLLKSYRQVWLKLQQDCAELSKTELRKLNPATFSFLYRNDKDWLNKNSPKFQKRIMGEYRVNWQERDQEILRMVLKAIDHLKNHNEKLIRVTVKSIGDFIGERTLLEKHLDKMPNTKECINKESESEQDYRLRRVKHKIDEMNEAREVIKVWRVIRKAGIKEKYKHEIIDIVKKTYTNFK